MASSRIGRAFRRLLGPPAAHPDTTRWRASVDRRLDDLLRQQRDLQRETRAWFKDETRWRERFRHQLDALEACTTRVLVMEYNARLGADRAVTVPASGVPEGVPKGYSGASLPALERKTHEKGYGLVLCEGERAGTDDELLHTIARLGLPLVDV